MINNNIFYFINSPVVKKSLITINKGIYASILSYLTKIKEVRLKLNLELNKTIKRHNTVYLYLTSINGKEIFQRLSQNNVLDFIIEIISTKALFQFEELVNLILTDPKIEASREEIISYIDKLLEVGFLRFKIGIPDQQIGWVNELCIILKNIDNKDVKLLITNLEQIEKKAKDYSNLPLTKRFKRLSELQSIWEDILKRTDGKMKFGANLPLYEDSTSNSRVSVNGSKIEYILEYVSNYIMLTKRIAYPRIDQATMRCFFDTHYKNEDEEIYLLRFYEDYYRLHFKEHLEKISKIQNDNNNKEFKDYNFSNPFKLSIISEIQNAQVALQNLIITKWNENLNSDEIKFETKEIEQLLKNIPDTFDDSISASVFAQIVNPNNIYSNPELVVNGGRYLLGYGKYFSRFLRLFRNEMQQKFYYTNNISNNEIIAEISGDANFNANLHPRLLKFEISYPSTEVGMAEEQIKCTDIIVEHDKNDLHALKLRHKMSNKYILPVDLGFLNPMMRPPLFQLLSKFSPPNIFSFPLPENPVMKNVNTKMNQSSNQEKIKKENTNNETNDTKNKGIYDKQQNVQEIICRPRIILESSIVIARKTWFVPGRLFPSIGNNETNEDYFIKANRWRKENNIPNEVYVKVRPLPVTNKRINNYESKNEDNENKIRPNTNGSLLRKEHEEESIIGNQKNIDENKTKNTTQNKFSRDYFKPQYIDFYNPLLVNLFGKLVVNLHNYNVIIEERYPISSQLPKFNNEAYSTEQIFQVNFSHNERNNYSMQVGEHEIGN